MHFAKNLQWNIAYYFILVFAALLAIIQTTKPPVAICVLTYTLAAIAFDFSVYVLVQIQFHLRNTRLGITRTKYYRKRFRTAERFREQRRDDARFLRDVRFFVPILVTACIAFTVVAISAWDTAQRLLLELVEKLIH